MRAFQLVRQEDVTGVSGTGVVAEGVEFTDGSVALRWVGKNPTSVVFHDNGIASVNKIHGHDGKTKVKFVDGHPADFVDLITQIHKMISELDTALHGFTYARDQTPQDVWASLLTEVGKRIRSAN